MLAIAVTQLKSTRYPRGDAKIVVIHVVGTPSSPIVHPIPSVRASAFPGNQYAEKIIVRITDSAEMTYAVIFIQFLFRSFRLTDD